MKKVLTNMLPKSCTVTHVVFAALIRDLYDLDSWLRGTGHGGDSLPDSRAVFWKLSVDEQGGVSVPEEHATRILYMPESPDNSNKVRTVSGAPHVYLPASIPPLNCQQEETLISSIIRELNDTYDTNVTEKPDLSRSSGDAFSMTENMADRIFVIGASHVKRMVGGLESLNMDIVDLSRLGWKADAEHIADIAEKLKKYDITDTDTN
jgi:hypothetical protein